VPTSHSPVFWIVSEWPTNRVRREKSLVYSGRKSRPGTGSLHPVAVEAAAAAMRKLRTQSHRLSRHFPRTLSRIFNTIPTILTAFPPRLSALPKLCSDPRCRSNPIAHRVRRKRQRLPPSLLIENASVRYPAPRQKSAPRRFRSRLATKQELPRGGSNRNAECGHLYR
jgi:hypothetical protein